MIRLMQRRGWSLRRIARAIKRPIEYVRRIEDRKQSFQLTDVQALAKACKAQPYRLVFDSIQRESVPREIQGLYELASREVDSHESFVRVLKRKSGKKRRVGRKAA